MTNSSDKNNSATSFGWGINKCLRKNIQNLKPYSSARSEYAGEAMVFLDANENPFNQPYNRYPDPQQKAVKEKVATVKKMAPENIFLGNGSDEAIDLLIRAFCEPGVDNIVTIAPTYGMYQVAADVSDIEVRQVALTDDFQLDKSKVLAATSDNTKLIFLCSPNNPTGNSLNKEAMLELVSEFNGIVIVDEAYIDFAPEKTLMAELKSCPNMVILQTFSKAWGMAGLRLGMAFADTEIINVLNKIKYPYNLNVLIQEKALELLDKKDTVQKWVSLIVAEREKMKQLLVELPFVVKVYPSDANFLLVQMHDATGIYNYLVEEGIIVRDRSKINLCNSCLRITIGSPDENTTLLNALKRLI